MKTVITTLFLKKAVRSTYCKKFCNPIMLLMLIIGVLRGTASFGQASGYTFAASAGTYTAITGGTVLNADPFNLDEWISNQITLTPGFTFNGTLYTTAYVSSNGFITLGIPRPMYLNTIR